MARTPYYPAVNERIRVIGCYSEVMMHLGLAGKPCEVALIPAIRMNGEPTGQLVAQVYVDGRTFSSPILPSEAGFYEDDGHYYTYPAKPNEQGDDDPMAEAKRMRDLILDALTPRDAQEAQS